MKAVLLVLTLAFTGSQTIAFTDCRCGVVCAHQQGARDGACGDAAPPQGCCEEETGGCVHLEPSSETISTPICVDLASPAEFPAPAPPEAAPPAPALTREPFAELRPARGRPLYLLHSSLLI